MGYSGLPIQKSRGDAQNSIHADTIQNRHKQKLQQTLSSNVFKEPDMNADQILMEIRETNLSYLMLAQSLIRTDREQALFRLGISEDTAAMLTILSPAQIMKIAASNTLLCRMRVDDDLVWGLLTNHGKSSNDSVTRLHANILMAGRHQEAA
jgi:flagellar transcriptional activator FlhD